VVNLLFPAAGAYSNAGDCVKSAACRVLTTPDPDQKTRLSEKLAAAWFEGRLSKPQEGASTPPDLPKRTNRPPLVRPGDVPRRDRGAPLALLHAITHIEFTAIDLAWDLIARFSTPSSPQEFLDDWVRVASDETRHYLQLQNRLNAAGVEYGDMPAHDGLWQAAHATRHDLLARLAVVPLVLEARGLDVTPAMIDRFRGQNDQETAEVLTNILAEEVTHVEAGARWFHYYCRLERKHPATTYHAAVRRYFKGQLKHPFNAEARKQTGLSEEFYLPLAKSISSS